MTSAQLSQIVFASRASAEDPLPPLTVFFDAGLSTSDIDEIVDYIQDMVDTAILNSVPEHERTLDLDLRGGNALPSAHALEVSGYIRPFVWGPGLASNGVLVRMPEGFLKALAPPAIGGNVAGKTLTVTPATWYANTTHVVSHQWFVNNQPVAGATGTSFSTVGLAPGALVTCRERVAYNGIDPVGFNQWFVAEALVGGVSHSTGTLGYLHDGQGKWTQATWDTGFDNPPALHTGNEMWFSGGYFYLSYQFPTGTAVWRATGMSGDFGAADYAGSDPAKLQWEAYSGVTSGGLLPGYEGGVMGGIPYMYPPFSYPYQVGVHKDSSTAAVVLIPPPDLIWTNETDTPYLGAIGRPVPYVL